MSYLLKPVVEAAQKNTRHLDTDYIETDGLRYCGQCRTKKETVVDFPGMRGVPLPVMCKCEEEQEAAEEAKRKEREEMEKVKRLRTQAIQDRQLLNYTFANDDGSNPKITDKIMRYCVMFNEMLEKNIGLLFWGPVGTGKTYIGGCAANYLVDLGIPVLMTSFSKIINALSGFIEQDKNGYIESFNRYKLLIIDDLGAERQSEFAQEVVYAVIDGRYKNGQPLIVTTNMTLDEIKNPPNLTHSRIYDRILEMCVPIQFSGESRRRAAFQDKISKARAIFED